MTEPADARQLLVQIGTPSFLADLESDGAMRWAAVSGGHDSIQVLDRGPDPSEDLVRIWGESVRQACRQAATEGRAVETTTSVLWADGRRQFRVIVTPLLDPPAEGVTRVLGLAAESV